MNNIKLLLFSDRKKVGAVEPSSRTVIERSACFGSSVSVFEVVFRVGSSAALTLVAPEGTALISWILRNHWVPGYAQGEVGLA